MPSGSEPVTWAQVEDSLKSALQELTEPTTHSDDPHPTRVRLTSLVVALCF